MELKNVFKLLQGEISFIDEILGIGVTELYKCDFTRKGIYYQCFTCLSTGLERLMKIIICMEHYYKESKFYNEKELKDFGHNLLNLYQQCQNIGSAYSVKKNFSEQETLYKDIIKILSDFADVGNDNRYYNLNYLSKADAQNFVLPKETKGIWHETIDKYIYNNKITKQQKNKAKMKFSDVGLLLYDYSLTRFISENNDEIDNSIDFTNEMIITNLCRGYRVLFVSQIIRYLSNILNNYNELLQGNNNIPYYYDFLQFFRLDDSILLKKKKYTK